MKASEFTDNLSEEDFREEIGEMAHLWEQDSGLPYRVMIDSMGIERKRENNSPRVFISMDKHYERIFPVSIDKGNPKILINLEDEVKSELLFNWIKNTTVL